VLQKINKYFKMLSTLGQTVIPSTFYYANVISLPLLRNFSNKTIKESKIDFVHTPISTKRVEGLSKKLLLRAINRNIVSRIARRASIGIPLLGFYFVQRVLRNDLKQATNPENPPKVQNGYKFVSSVDAIDLMAQTAMITSLALTLFFPEITILSSLEIIKYADKVSIGAALTSCSLGTYLEYQKEVMQMQKSLKKDEDKGKI
jgi:hypothetical protein